MIALIKTTDKIIVSRESKWFSVSLISSKIDSGAIGSISTTTVLAIKSPSLRDGLINVTISSTGQITIVTFLTMHFIELASVPLVQSKYLMPHSILASLL